MNSRIFVMLLFSWAAVASSFAWAETKTERLLAAQQLDSDLRSLDWFAEEYLRKAKKSKLDEQPQQALFFLQKADNALTKTHRMRKRAVKNWQYLDNQKAIVVIWSRAIRVANIRVGVLQMKLDDLNEQLLLAEVTDKKLTYRYWDAIDDVSNQWYIIASYYAEIDKVTQQIIALQSAMLNLSPVLFLSDSQLSTELDTELNTELNTGEQRLQPIFEQALNLNRDLIVLLEQLGDANKAQFYREEEQRLQERLKLLTQ